LFVAVASLCLFLLGGEGWMFHRFRKEATRELAALQKMKLDRDSLVHHSPALSPESEAALTADLAVARTVLTEWRSVLPDDEPGCPSTPLPSRPIGAFFELADIIRQLRAKAAQSQVGIRPDERFGFAAYANEGPAPDQIAVVHRQCYAIRYLVGKLLESSPMALLSVRRERPGADAARDLRPWPDDFFEWDRALTLRQPGLIESEAFRLEFTGQTGTLRGFLSSIAQNRLPFVVRRVEVEPWRAESSGAAAALPTAPGAPGPLVKPMLSKFGVTLELARLETNPATAR
jgi:hypothetical protein